MRLGQKQILLSAAAQSDSEKPARSHRNTCLVKLVVALPQESRYSRVCMRKYVDDQNEYTRHYQSQDKEVTKLDTREEHYEAYKKCEDGCGSDVGLENDETQQ